MKNGWPRADAGPGTSAGAKREAPIYGPNLRASCRRLDAGWLRTLRARICSWLSS
nr:hypothetical protein [Escherichia coli]